MIQHLCRQIAWSERVARAEADDGSAEVPAVGSLKDGPVVWLTPVTVLASVKLNTLNIR